MKQATNGANAPHSYPFLTRSSIQFVPRGEEYLAFMETLYKRVHLSGSAGGNRDNIIVLDGDEGAGKSSLAATLLHHIHELWGFKPPDPEDVIFDWGDWDRQYSYKAKRQVYWIDEGGDLLLNLDWNSESIRRFRKLVMKARALNSTIIICIPDFWVLDKYIREHRARWRIYVEDRGYAVVQERAKNWRKAETWFEDVFPIGDRERGERGWDGYETAFPEFAKRYEERKMESIERSDWTNASRNENYELSDEDLDVMKQEYKNKRRLDRYRKWGVVPPSKPSSLGM